ncbi:MAG: peptide/nickel transport system permease protein [Solirubrobacteraceae bacterium]|nr:peptide/nickel transport system permease protein [Solirubrobacteraceae bacterium]
MTTGGSELLLQEESGPPGIGGVESERSIAARSPLDLFWRRLRRDKVAMTALVFIVLLMLVAIFAPVIVKILGAPNPNVPDRSTLDSFGLPSTAKGGGPGSKHFFGVDQLGRDVFSRTLYGARISLEVALIATFISVVVGVTLGMIAGFYRGAVDSLLSRVMDIQLAFPVLLLAIGLGAACSIKGCIGGLLQPGLPVVIFVIALAQWPYMARIIRGQTLSLREKEFVEAARAAGASNTRIVFREVLPNLVAPIIVYSTVLIPTNILFETALSFLGVGVQPPTPSWGAMLSEAQNIFDIAWWFMLFPGLALLLTVLAFNLVGDGLQDALNPRRK